MKIVHGCQQPGSSTKADVHFTGTVHTFLVFPETDSMRIWAVSFSSGARTFWHSHEGGQILQIRAGRGLIQSAGGSVNIVHAGDTIWIPAGERHWHGAAPDTFMAHDAITLGATLWDRAVSDDEYTNAAVEGNSPGDEAR